MRSTQGEQAIPCPSAGPSGGIPSMQHSHGRTCGPTRRSTKGQWTAEEDEILRKAVERYKGKNWKKIAECFKDRSDVQCLHRWQKVLNPELVKGPWSKEEDEIIIELVNKYGPKKWSTIAQHLPGRIGKQCRERWHNHLNPAINKEAWTQDEELTLIRAHQMFGNRWAELTKFLPGRSDNAIKNHWNSSVRKKLDSYMASGLLDQLRSLPLVERRSNSLPSSSSKVMSSCDDSDSKAGVEMEETGCCQSSSAVGGSKSVNDMLNEVTHTGEQCHQNEVGCVKEQQTSIEICCPPMCDALLEDEMYPTFNVPCEVEDTDYPKKDLSDGGMFITQDYHLCLKELENIASDDLSRAATSGVQTQCVETNGKSIDNAAPATSVSSGASRPSVGAGCHVQSQVLISDDECCKALFPEALSVLDTSVTEQKQDTIEMGESRSFLHGQNSSFSETNVLPTPAHSTSDQYGTFHGQMFPSLVSADGTAVVPCNELDQLDCEFDVLEPVENAVANNAAMGMGNTSYLWSDILHGRLDEESLESVPVRSAAPGDNTEGDLLNMQQGSGVLCYEPPRFPSADFPFLCCDLVESSSNLQQEYSPLGIRQLMLSSMNCLTPCRLWDSPSKGGSPAAVLKNAAKSFAGTPSIIRKRSCDLLSPLSSMKCLTPCRKWMSPSLDVSPAGVFKNAAKCFGGTPSILRKRSRDLLSPLSARRGKKVGKDITSSLAKDFSRLEAMLGERGNEKPLALLATGIKGNPDDKDKENRVPAFNTERQVEGKDIPTSSIKLHTLGIASHCGSKVGVESVVNSREDANAAIEFEQDSFDAPSEYDINDLLLSPGENGSKLDKGPSAISHTPNHRQSSAFICPNDNLPNDPCTENFGNFSGTPFRKLKSPSAWKSPWFFNSFVADRDFTVEEIGFLLSPGDRSYDALGLMKQMNERTASAYADALHVLGNDTPETIRRKRQLRLSSQQKSHSQSPASSVLSERRALDFSDCGTPGRSKDGKASSITTGSPSSYLLKSCR